MEETYIKVMIKCNPEVDISNYTFKWGNGYLIPIQPIKEITDEDIKKWAKDQVLKFEDYPDRPYGDGMIKGAKAYRDGLITGTGKSNDKEIIQKQEELIETMGMFISYLKGKKKSKEIKTRFEIMIESHLSELEQLKK